jgi:two-component sensor histidine kinase
MEKTRPILVSIVFLIGMLIPFPTTAQPASIDSLRTELEDQPNSPEKVQSMLGMVKELNNIDLEKGIELARETLNIADQLGNDSLQADCYLALGRTFANQGNLDSALFYFREGKIIATRINDPYRLASCYVKHNYVYLYTGLLDSALFYGIEALKTYKSLDDAKGISIGNQIIADVLGKQERYEEALPYAQEGAIMAEEARDTLEMTTAYKNISFLYIWLQDYEQALEYANRSIHILESGGDQMDLSLAYFNRGNVYKNIPDWDAAIKDYELAFKLVKEIDYVQYKAYLYESLGYCYIEKGDFQKGIPMALKGINIKREIGNASDILEALQFTAQAYQQVGKTDSAYLLLEEYVETKENVYRVEVEEQMNEIRTEYETEKISEENETLQTEKRQQAYLLIGAIIVILLVGTLSLLLWRNSQKRKEANAILSDQKAEIELKNQQNEVLLKEIHHRVKNNLQVISSLLRLQSSQISDKTVREAVEAGESRVKSMALIHQKLYQRDNLSGIEMKDYLTNLGQDLIASMAGSNPNIELEIAMKPIELDVDTAIPLGLITNELVTNSLKYAFPDKQAGKISLSLYIDADKNLVLVVKDNGVGDSDQSQNKESTSFGSQLVSLLGMQLGGKLTTEIDQGRTTRLIISEFKGISVNS